MSWLPPGLLLAVLLILISSQVLYAFLPVRPRPYTSVVIVTAAAWILGQLWQGLGWPAWHIGEADVLPAFLFAILLQPVARLLPPLRIQNLNLRRFGDHPQGK